MGRKRNKIGLIYQPTTSWIAGSYYVLNIVHSLNTVADEDKPLIVVFCKCDNDFDDMKSQTSYPYLKKRIIYPTWNSKYTIFMRILRKLTGIDLGDYEKYPICLDRVKFVYPFSLIDDNQTKKTKCLGWIPDFQDKYLQYLFSKEELKVRDEAQRSFINYNVPLVFSSNDARNDFFKFHPEGKNLKTFIAQFAVTPPDFSKENIEILKEKYDIEKNYLFCANQFWTHKNHLFLFEAYKEAKNRGLDLQLVCSGKLSDYRDKEYSDKIRAFIKDNKLEDDIKILGFIERTEQLCLMNNCYAVVQPSLFEGWSTVVEDAKCLNKFIFLSNLPVHQEQISENVCFFDPHNKSDLVEKLIKIKPKTINIDYKHNIKVFAEQFIKIIKEY